MKAIDAKSILLGVVATSLVYVLSSGKTVESNENIEFVASPMGLSIYNKETKTLYLYRVSGLSTGLQEKPSSMYLVADDGASLSKK